MTKKQKLTLIGFSDFNQIRFISQTKQYLGPIKCIHIFSKVDNSFSLFLSTVTRRRLVFYMLLGMNDFPQQLVVKIK